MSKKNNKEMGMDFPEEFEHLNEILKPHLVEYLRELDEYAKSPLHNVDLSNLPKLELKFGTSTVPPQNPLKPLLDQRSKLDNLQTKIGSIVDFVLEGNDNNPLLKEAINEKINILNRQKEVIDNSILKNKESRKEVWSHDKSSDIFLKQIENNRKEKDAKDLSSKKSFDQLTNQQNSLSNEQKVLQTRDDLIEKYSKSSKEITKAKEKIEPEISQAAQDLINLYKKTHQEITKEPER